MRDVASIADTPPAELRFRRRVGLISTTTDLWRSREVVRSLADRDFRARYKQAVLGVAWAVINPLVLALVFTFTVRRFAHVQTDGVPYIIWAYTGLVAWGFFAGTVTGATACLVNNQPLLNKVNVPRETFPVATVVLSAVDSAISMIGLIAFFAIYGRLPRTETIWVPVILLVQLACVTGVALIVSIVVVYLRDLRQIVPILIQIGLFATPVAYNISQLLSPGWRLVYSFANPMAPIIDSYRRTVLYGQPPQWLYLGAGAVTSLVLLAGGLRIFKRLELGIADLI